MFSRNKDKAREYEKKARNAGDDDDAKEYAKKAAEYQKKYEQEIKDEENRLQAERQQKWLDDLNNQK